MDFISHPLDPVFDDRSIALVLGTMPSPVSRETGFYYGHPQNRFWNVLGKLFEEETTSSPAGRAAFVLKHRIALWDVLASCSIQGAADASITDPRPNDLSLVIDNAPIATVFTTGTKAAALYRALCSKTYPNLPHIALPSTSAANARMSLSDLVGFYEPIKSLVEPAMPHRP